VKKWDKGKEKEAQRRVNREKGNWKRSKLKELSDKKILIQDSEREKEKERRIGSLERKKGGGDHLDFQKGSKGKGEGERELSRRGESPGVQSSIGKACPSGPRSPGLEILGGENRCVRKEEGRRETCCWEDYVWSKKFIVSRTTTQRGGGKLKRRKWC